MGWNRLLIFVQFSISITWSLFSRDTDTCDTHSKLVSLSVRYGVSVLRLGSDICFAFAILTHCNLVMLYCVRTWSRLVQVMAWCLFRHLPILTNHHQWGLVAFTWWQFHRKCSRYFLDMSLKMTNWRSEPHLDSLGANELMRTNWMNPLIKSSVLFLHEMENSDYCQLYIYMYYYLRKKPPKMCIPFHYQNWIFISRSTNF